MASLIIILHGSGGTGHQLRIMFEALPLQYFGGRTFRQVSELMSMEILTPTAPEQRYAPYMNDYLNVWFDRSPDFLVEGMTSQEDLRGIDTSLKKILRIVEENKNDYRHIFIGGFSMGGCLALHLLRHKLPPNVRGIFTMGSFLVDTSAVNVGPLYHSDPSIPVLMMHGSDDVLIGVDWGRKTAANLTVSDVDVQFKEYQNVEHDIGDEMMVDLLNWIQDIILQVRQQESNPEAQTAAFVTPISQIRRAGESEADAIGDKVPIAVTIDSNYLSSDSTPKVDSSKASSSTASSSAATRNVLSYIGQYKDAPVPFAVESSSAETGSSFILKFAVPPDMIDIICDRPVLACGGVFQLQRHTLNVVLCVAQTSDPVNLGQEIGKRLLRRIADGGQQVNPCPMG